MRTTSSLLHRCRFSVAFVLLGACSNAPANPEPTSAERPVEEADPAVGATTSQTVARSELQRRQPQVTLDEKAAFVAGHNAFAFDLYELIRAEEGAGRNAFFSPTSITLALSMAYAGASGQTAEEMAGALHYSLPPDRLLEGFNWLGQELGSRAEKAYATASQGASREPRRDDFRLRVVNSMWGERTMTFEGAFLDTLATHYDAGVYLADFKNAPEAERVRINDWVANETLERIKDLIPETSIDASTRSVLVNAIHLKMPWSSPFSTAPDLTFKRLDGSMVAAPSIRKRGTWRYLESEGLQAVLIPLQGGDVNVLVVAPADGGLNAFEDALSADELDNLLGAMQAREVIFRMPKIHFTTPSMALKSRLQALGMNVAFTRSADFSAISRDEPLSLSELAHKAMLGVDENGVEAAAATAVFVAGGGSAPSEPIPFDVDRPFFVGLIDVPTHALLFAGHIVDPNNEH